MMTLNGKKPVYRRSYTLETWNFGHWELRALEGANKALGVGKIVSLSEEADVIEYVRIIHEEYVSLMEGHVFFDIIRRPAHLCHGQDVEYVRVGEPVYTFHPESGQVDAVTQLRYRIKTTESKKVSVVVDGKEYTRTEQAVTFGEWLEPEGLVSVKVFNISVLEIFAFE